MLNTRAFMGGIELIIVCLINAESSGKLYMRKIFLKKRLRY